MALHALAAGLLWQAWQRHPAPKPPLLVPVHWIAPAPPQAQPRPQPAIAEAAPTRSPPRTPVAPEPRLSDNATATAESTPSEPRLPDTPLSAARPEASIAPAQAAPPPPPPPQRVSITAPRYLAEPKLNMPLASRRLGEQGLVQLRLHIGTQGELLAASVARSSGFERLDAQALKDIRTARFAPLVENGHALEWECLALLSYELTR